MKPIASPLLFPAIVLAAILSATAMAGTDEFTTALAIPGNPEKGRTAYEICRGCHKADGSGRADAEYPQLAGQHATVLLKQMTDIRSGKRLNPRMHPFVSQDVVPTEELAHIAAYLASLPTPSGNGKGDGRSLEHGGKLYARDCARCHGDEGEGSADKFIPRLAGQHFSYLVRENKAIQNASGHRRDADPAMIKVISHYSYKDIAAVSDYLSRLTPAR